MLLVRSFFSTTDADLIPLKRRHDDCFSSQSVFNVTVTKACPAHTASSLTSNFVTAVSCWELLQQSEELRNEFSKICHHLRTDCWLWLPNFVIDGFLYQGRYGEALSKLQTAVPTVTNTQSVLLKSAGILFCLGNVVVSHVFSDR